MKTNLTTVVIIIVICIGVSFYVGMQFGSGNQIGSLIQNTPKALTSTPAPKSDLQNILGTVVSTTDASVTIKAQDNSVQMLSVSTSTVITKNVSLKLADLKPGVKVVATGRVDSNGVFSTMFLNVVQDQAQTAPASK